MSGLESQYEQKARQAELSAEAMELLTDELQAALESLRSREERTLHRQEEMENLRVRTDRLQKQVRFLRAISSKAQVFSLLVIYFLPGSSVHPHDHLSVYIRFH